MQRNKETKKECCNKAFNFVFKGYTDGTAELKCSKCGHTIKTFDAPKPMQK